MNLCRKTLLHHTSQRLLLLENVLVSQVAALDLLASLEFPLAEKDHEQSFQFAQRLAPQKFGAQTILAESVNHEVHFPSQLLFELFV